MDHPLPEQLRDLPEAFTDLVRDALLHLYDPAQLQVHPLLTAARTGTAPAGLNGGRMLRQALLDAINALQPAPGIAATSRAWRAYRILELRYIEAHEVADMLGLVALSKSQYHREHQRALHALAAILWERWGLAGRWFRPGLSEMPPARDTGLARSEADVLRTDAAVRIDPIEVLRGVVKVVEPLCVVRGIELRVSVPDRAPTVHGDRVALRQAILTVLGHAAATLDTGPLDVTVASPTGQVVLTVSGPATPGLGPEHLGTSECEPFVEALGGRVAFRAAELPAGRWSVTLACPAEEPDLLLAVDNNDDFRRLVERYLVGYPWSVVGAATVDEAYDLARLARPAAILLDVVLPGRDGWELLLELKQLAATRDIPVIVCSVLGEPAVAIALGAAAYLQKPIDQERLLGALATATAAERAAAADGPATGRYDEPTARSGRGAGSVR